MEIWKKIKDYNLYQVSNLGRVKSLIGKEKILKLIPDPHGYLTVRLHGKRFRIHRLVAIAFLENFLNKKEVNHKNKIRTDNRVENLEWNTRKENEYHKNNFNLINFSSLIKKEINRLIPIN